jgi:hypothetical protein
MLGARRGGLVVGVAGVLAAGMPGCFILRCDDTFHHVSEGDRFTSTILGPYADGEGAPSCGELGDLPVGTTLTWTATPDGPGDGCDDELDMEVTMLSTGSVDGHSLTLPNGCSGTWVLTAHPLRDDTDFLANDLEAPRWYIARYLTSPSAECFPDGSAPTSCGDSFIASSSR